MDKIFRHLPDLSPLGAIVATSWRKKGGNVCNERFFVITLHQKSEIKIHAKDNLVCFVHIAFRFVIDL